MFPKFFIIGAAKSGTTSLDAYLNGHPDVLMCGIKESHFFAVDDFPARFEGPGDNWMNDGVIHDPTKYEELFGRSKPGQLLGESSVFYLYYPSVPCKIHLSVPDAKVIAVLRNPIDRAYSAYLHLVKEGRERLPFDEALKIEESRKKLNYEPLWFYKDVGLYSYGIKRFMDVFGESNVKVILYDALEDNAARVMNDVQEFLELRPHVINTSRRYNVSGYPKSPRLHQFMRNPSPMVRTISKLFPKPLRRVVSDYILTSNLDRRPMSAESRSYLEEYFREEVRKLEEMLGTSLRHWIRPN